MQGNESWPAAVRAVCSLLLCLCARKGWVWFAAFLVFFFYGGSAGGGITPRGKVSPLGKGDWPGEAPHYLLGVSLPNCLMCMGTWDGSEKME